MKHRPETFLCDRVLFYRKGDTRAHVAFVIEVHSEHCADLVCYCPASHQWFEAASVEYGKRDDADFFVNPEE